MERKMEMRIEQLYGSRFVEDEEYYNKRVIRMEIVLYGRDYSSPPSRTAGDRNTVPCVVEKSYGCCKTFFVDRDQLLSSLPSVMSQLVVDDEDGFKVVAGDDENERRELFEKINAYAQSMPEPMLVRGTRVAAELFIRIKVDRWKRLPAIGSHASSSN